MDFVFILLTLSALLGVATGLRFRVFAILPVSLLIMMFSAVILFMNGFGFEAVISIIILCLVVGQIGYFIGLVFIHSSDDPAEDGAGDDGNKTDQQDRER